MNKRPETAGKRLTRTRKALGLSQAQFERIMGISHPTLTDWEQTEPRLNEKRTKVLLSLGINPQFIVVGTGDIIQPDSTMIGCQLRAEKALEACK